jgi:putative transposase
VQHQRRSTSCTLLKRRGLDGTRCTSTQYLFPRILFRVKLHHDATRPHGGCRLTAPRDAARESAEAIFFEDGDHEVYRDLLAEQTRKAGVDVWAYCFMPNHVHLILTAKRTDGLGLAVGETHRRYTNFINARGRWTGHLFQSRFASVAMDEAHLMAAVCYVSLNPVRARLVARAEDWPSSSVRAHLAGADDRLVTVRPVLDRAPRFADAGASG